MADQIYMASVESTYAAMEQMLQFSAVLDVVSRNADERTVTFSVPGINGLFTAKVVEGDAAGSSKVTVTAPIDGGDKAQESVAKFYKDLGDQLMVQGTVQSAPEQTSVFDAQNQPTQTFQAPVPAAAGNGGNPTQGTKNKFVAMLTDTNTGKTSVMAIAAAVVSAVFLIFGFVSLGMHPPVVVGIIFAVVAAVLCGLAYTKTQPGREHGRRLTVIAAAAAVVALLLSVIGGATGSASSSSSTAPINEDCKPLEFPRDGISAKLPEIKKITGRISYEYSDHMSMRVCGMSTNAYDNYLTEVKKAGFTVDYEKGSHSYQALNNDGDKIRLYYDGDDQRLSIEIESASYLEEQEKERAEYEKEQKEKEEKETAEQQKADEAAKKKAEEQKQAEEERKKAEEEQKRAEEEQKKAQEEEAGKQQEQNQAQSGGVTPAVKEAMDSYESYMNKYCDFMEKYNKEGAPASMLTDYLSMLKEYNGMTKKIDDMDQSSWSDADTQYYLEVMNRVNQRLASIS